MDNIDKGFLETIQENRFINWGQRRVPQNEIGEIRQEPGF